MSPSDHGAPAERAPLGERIAYYRRRRGLSQVKLAGLLGRSESWVSQVERGVRPVDRVSVLSEVASALNVPVSELTPESLASVEEQEDHPAVAALRQLLIDYTVFLLPSREDRLPPVVMLEDDLEQVWAHVHASRYTDLVTLLPRVITDAETLTRAGDPDAASRSRQLTAEAYQAAGAMLAKLSETDLAWLAGDRAVRTANHADAHLLAVAGIVRIGHAFLMGGRSDDARRVAFAGLQAIEDETGEESVEAPPERLSLFGSLQLIAAVAATRQSQVEAARDHLSRAEWAASQLGEDRNDFHTEFGPTNVAVHAVSITVESGDAGEALRRAARIDPEQLSAERRARFLIDVARAHGQRRQVDEAVHALREAEKLAPEQVHSHELVREMVRDLLRAGRREPGKQLRALARRIGVIP